jgi:hypothetical protein
VPADELSAKEWFTVNTVALSGRGLAPVAYQLSWADRTVLFSGRLPIKRQSSAVDSLFQEFSEVPASHKDYADSLDRLAGLKPDLWLPGAPVDGQNANLYGPEWEEIIEANRQLAP